MSRKNSHTPTLFHYTRSRHRLFSILKNGLKFSYCEEDFNNERFVAFPMICFCDIPVSDSEEHSSKYGKYAIGLSKEALIKNYQKGLGPVNYVLSPSFVESAFLLRDLGHKYSDELSDLIKNADEERKTSITFMGQKYTGIGLNANEGMDTMKKFFDSINYSHYSSKGISLMKPYYSDVDGKRIVNYDECEWRIVLPEHAKLAGVGKIKWYWDRDEYRKWCEGRKNRLINVPLTFNVKDINHLIVPKDKDIPSVVEAINKLGTLCSNPLNSEEKAILISKVISYEQIRNNF